jgi:hypothetical protein
LAVNLVINEDERTLDAELRMLRDCLAIIQDCGYLEETRNRETGSAKMCINFIEKNKHKYPEQRREIFKGEFKRLKELFNTLLSFFVSINKKS